MRRIIKETNIEVWPNTINQPKKIKWLDRSFNRINGKNKYYYAIFKIDKKDTNILLHRLVWEKYNKRIIPNGYDVHHIDMNQFNNHPSNLKIIKSIKHKNIHLKDRLINNPYWWKNGIEKAQESAKKWHASDEGIKWHSKQGKYTWSVRKTINKKCIECGKEFKTYWPKKSKYCSPICSSRNWTKNNPSKIKKYNNNRNEKRQNN